MFSRFKYGICIALFIFAVFSAPDAEALTPAEVEAATKATDAVPVATDMIGELGNTLTKVFKIFRIPLGALQVGLFPIPGFSLGQGINNIMKGVLVPVEIVIDVARIGIQGATQILRSI